MTKITSLKSLLFLQENQIKPRAESVLVSGLTICCMTVDVKVNVLEKRISQLFKVTFLSKKLGVSTDPFLYRENASDVSL